jgi:hypothetical protein
MTSRPRRLRAFRICAAILALALPVGGCVAAAAAPSGSAGGHDSIAVTAGAETVAASRDPSTHDIVLTSHAPGRSDVSTSFTYGSSNLAVRFSTFQWAAGGISDTYIYGIAPIGAASIDLLPAGEGAVAPDGTFVAVVAGDAAASPSSFHWRFLSSAGVVLAEGNGEH